MNRTRFRLFAIATLAPAAVALAGCDNACDFWKRCRGDVLQTCGSGVDQVFHRRVEETPCVAPNGACVETGGNDAQCVRAPPQPCDDAFAARCEGAVRVYCSRAGPQRFVVSEDCSPAGGPGGGGRCVPDARAGAVCAP